MLLSVATDTHFMMFLLFGCVECVQLLLAHGAPVKVKNNQGWTPLAEAVSYGDRQTSECHSFFFLFFSLSFSMTTPDSLTYFSIIVTTQAEKAVARCDGTEAPRSDQCAPQHGRLQDGTQVGLPKLE